MQSSSPTFSTPSTVTVTIFSCKGIKKKIIEIYVQNQWEEEEEEKKKKKKKKKKKEKNNPTIKLPNLEIHSLKK